MFEIRPKRGRPFVVNGDHILSLVRTNEKRYPGGGIVNVSVLDWFGWNRWQKHLHKLYRSPGVEFPIGEDLHVDPYFLGVLLGDGCLVNNQISVCKPDPEILALCEAEALRWGIRVSTKLRSQNNPSHSFTVGDGGLRRALKDLQLMETRSGDKFIPRQYKLSSRPNRLSLLAGLLDTDGHMSHAGYDYVSKSPQLAEDVAFVARSLGLSAPVSPCRKACQTGAVGDYYRVSISGDCSIIPCRIPRKVSPARRQKKNNLRAGFSVTELGDEDFYGFTLDGDNLYLLDDFTVTHNSGKTALASHICSGVVAKGGTVLWFAPREELVAQGYDALTALGLSCGAIMSNPLRPPNPHRPVQVASLQTLLARGIIPDVSFVVGDEAHHFVADEWGKLLAEYRNRKVRGIGLTATPVRADGRALEAGFDDLIVPVRMKELVANGVLVPCQVHAPASPLRSNQIAQRPVDAYQALAPGRKCIVFAGNVKSAEEFLAEFIAAGIPAGLVTGAMDVGERRRTLEAYKSNSLKVLLNISVLTEGFDDPATSCVILARSLGSLGLFLQITGRALRASPGKTDAILIDLHGSSLAFGAPDEDREYSLEGDGIVRKNIKRGPERFCLGGCGVLITDPDATVCNECFIMRPEVGGVIPDVTNTKLVRYEAKLRESTEKRKAYFEKLKVIAVTKGYSPWWAHTKYKSIYNERPDRSW